MKVRIAPYTTKKVKLAQSDCYAIVLILTAIQKSAPRGI
jgi:hypothetical protein